MVSSWIERRSLMTVDWRGNSSSESRCCVKRFHYLEHVYDSSSRERQSEIEGRGVEDRGRKKELQETFDPDEPEFFLFFFLHLGRNLALSTNAPFLLNCTYILLSCHTGIFCRFNLLTHANIIHPSHVQSTGTANHQISKHPH